jgi:hypothetical protein
VLRDRLRDRDRDRARVVARASLWLAPLALALAGAPAARAAETAPTPAEREQTRATMREIFESIRVLLPLSVNETRFAAPENRAAVESALEALATNADAVAAHARANDPARRGFGRSLARDAREARDRYAAGRYDSAAFQIQQATENCVACHTRLPSPGDSPVGENFVDRTAIAALPPAERARIEVATRQFDEATASYEKLLADPKVHPNELVAPLVDYLIVQVRVRGDFERPRKTLERFARRPDLWRHLRVDVERWARSLRELAPIAKQPPTLAAAQDVIARARAVDQYPADHRGLVHWLVASSILERLLDAGPPSDRDAAEAYYLLGLAETHVGETTWVSRPLLYLEAAIRLAPKEPFAQEAYLLLEEETVLDYTGSQGVALPESVEAHLAELRDLVDAE